MLLLKLQKKDNGELEFITDSQDFEVGEISNTDQESFINVNLTLMVSKFFIFK